MIFWIIWICGLILTVMTFKISSRCRDKFGENELLKENISKVQLLSILSMVMFDTLTPIGIAYMFLIRQYATSPTGILVAFYSIIFITLGILVIVYHKLDFFYKTISRVILKSSFVISIVGWIGIFYIYDLNIEVVTETFTETEERELLSFNNIPIKDVSGHIGRFHGEITSTNEIPYWYLDVNTNDGLYDSAPPSDSRIKLIEDDETSYLEIVTSTTVTTEYNNYNGTQRTLNEETSEEYKFYLPQSQFSNN